MNKQKSKIDKDDFLSPENMIRLYASGAFPMADEVTNKINWYLPEIRTIIPLNNYNIPRSLKKSLVSLNFEIKFDHGFLPVVEGCISWITSTIMFKQTFYFTTTKIGIYLCIYELFCCSLKRKETYGRF